jgi:transcriptional regulator with XRE-family HTH domain
MEILASQFRAARALLGKEQEDVAAWAELDRQEVGGWESARYKLFSSAAESLQRAYEKNGLEFVSPSKTEGAGVRWRRPGQDDPHRGAQFRAARAMADLSMREVEATCGVNRNFITRLERGKLGAVNLEMIRKLEAAFCHLNIELTPEGQSWGAGVRWIILDKAL